jgi:hypothetical protein
MKREIDFLNAYKKISQPSKNIASILKSGLLITTAAYCLFLIIVFSWWGFLKKDFQKIENQIEVKKTEIKKLEKKESLYVLLKNQLSFLSKVFSSGEDNRTRILSFLFQLSDGRSKITEIKISPRGEEVQLSGEAADAFALANFLDTIVSSEQLKVFSKITLNSLSRQKDGSYRFSLVFTYGKN